MKTEYDKEQNRHYVRVWRIQNPEKARVVANKASAKYVRSEKGKATRALWREKNKDKIRKKYNLYYQQNKERISAQRKINYRLKRCPHCRSKNVLILGLDPAQGSKLKTLFTIQCQDCKFTVQSDENPETAKLLWIQEHLKSQ